LNPGCGPPLRRGGLSVGTGPEGERERVGGKSPRHLLESRYLMAKPESEVTEILQDWSQGDPSALERLIPLVFEDLREIAGRMFQRESDGHTLQPTALVNEVYLRLI